MAKAESASSGRNAHTLYGRHEHALRQTLIALAAGQALHDHVTIPPQRHSLAALEAAAVLLTVAVRL